MVQNVVRLGKNTSLNLNYGHNLMPLNFDKEVFIRFNLPPFHILQKNASQMLQRNGGLRDVGETLDFS